MDAKRLIDILARVDEDHFAVIENDCVELYSKAEFYATPTPKDETVEWISVKDRLPDPVVDVDVLYKRTGYMTV